MKHFKKYRIVSIYQRQLDGGHLGLRGKKFRTPTEGENHFSWIVMLKFKKKRQIWFFHLIRHPGYCIFCFFKMADSCCPSWIANFKLPPNLK